MCDENISVIRFRNLVDREKSRESIARKMTEQGLNCNTSTITKHYNGDRTISTEYVIKYAKYFGVSTDYLLGLSDIATTDTNIRSICDYTGLSEKSVNILNDLLNAGYYGYCKTINALIEEINFKILDSTEELYKENESVIKGICEYFGNSIASSQEVLVASNGMIINKSQENKEDIEFVKDSIINDENECIVFRVVKTDELLKRYYEDIINERIKNLKIRYLNKGDE